MTPKGRMVLVAALVAGAVLALVVEMWPKGNVPQVPDGQLLLRGKFVGPEAADDAAAFAGVCHAVADALEYDGRAASQRITTGLHLEDLRTGIAEMRFAPRPLRERQPHVRAAVGKYLDDTAGTSGGPLDATRRAIWVDAFRELAKASEEAVR